MEKTDSAVSHKEVRELLHDVRGPLVTMTGIGNELASALQQLADQIDAVRSLLPEKDAEQLDKIITDDIGPCMHHLQTSMQSLAGRVDEFRARERMKETS